MRRPATKAGQFGFSSKRTRRTISASLAMDLVGSTAGAELLQLESLAGVGLVLVGHVITFPTNRALESDWGSLI